MSFLFFSGASLYVLFLKSCQKKEQAYAGTRHALLVVLGLNLVIYLILLGVFRTELLAHRRWPVIDLMAVVKLVFLFVCIPGFHAVLRGGFFCGNPLLSE